MTQNDILRSKYFVDMFNQKIITNRLLVRRHIPSLDSTDLSNQLRFNNKVEFVCNKKV